MYRLVHAAVVSLAVALLPAAGTAQVHRVSTLQSVGDNLPNGDTVTAICNERAIARADSWGALVQLNGSSGPLALLVDGQAVLRDGDALSGASGATVDFALCTRPFFLTDEAVPVHTQNAGAGPTDTGVFIGLDPLLLPGQPFSPAPFGAGWIRNSARVVAGGGGGYFAVQSRLTPPSGFQTEALSVIRLDPTGALVEETPIAWYGATPAPLPGAVNPLAGGVGAVVAIDLNAHGELAWLVDVGVLGEELWVNTTRVAFTGAQLPGGQFQVDFNGVSLGDGGDYGSEIRLTVGSPSGLSVVLNGERYLSPGDLLNDYADIVVDRLFASLGGTVRNAIDPEGVTAWVGEHRPVGSMPTDPGTAALFRGRDVVVDDAAVTDTGEPVGLATWAGTVLSGNGRFALARRSASAGARESMLLVEMPIGARYGRAAVNSSGEAASLTAYGSSIAAANDLELDVRSAPPLVSGIALASASTAEVPLLGGGQGTLLVGSPITRLPGVFQMSPTGAATVPVDTTQPLLGGQTIAPGTTWNFQVWFRDSNPGTTSNLSSAVSIEFR